MDSKYWAYDCETYPNFFSIAFQHLATGNRWVFEISVRRDDSASLWWFLHQLIERKDVLIGYNNLNFDYPIIHEFLTLGKHRTVNSMDMYRKAEAIIGGKRNDWSHHIWESDHLIPQIDLFKIMHFDNFARSTSLKKLEVAMRSVTVEDLPVKPGQQVGFDMMDPVIDYMCWDVSETIKFAHEIWDRIQFRQELDKQYGGKTRQNYNDTKIGKEFLLDELKKSGVQTRTSDRKPTQTTRLSGIPVNDILLPVEFDTPDLRKIYTFFQAAVIPADKTKGFFTGLNAKIRDFQMDFGSGGIHGSIHKRTVTSDDEYCIMDCDVTSYYPSLAIRYGWYPEHLGAKFSEIYADLLEQRKLHAKGTPQNAMLKLALNGTYGESNNKYSSFYDPQFTMSITINGQLLLAKLMEMLLTNDAIEPIQINTDGLTVRLPRSHLDWYHEVCRNWSKWSLMDLEFVEYDKMAIRDVNNYWSRDIHGKIKRKNAYLTEPDWHQDHSALVVPKSVDQHLIDGTPVDHYIMSHTDPWDFMLSVKVPRSGDLLWGDQQVQNVTRYHIALNTGKPLVKVLDRETRPEEERRRIGVNEGWKVVVCNKAWDFSWHDLNRIWYIREAEKLLRGLGL